ncbi:MAG: hypothetical protein F4Z71_00810 [Gammaproteobacteria bacterium]|nr:hypothetical protein [Gammaproteobacteria bacterium]
MKQRKQKMPSALVLESQLALNRYVCACFGFEATRDLLAEFKNLRGESQSDESHPVLSRIADRAGNKVDSNFLRQYGVNIRTHSERLRIGARHPRNWKPHQYVALLLAEYYLHSWFEDADEMCRKLNLFKNSDSTIRQLPNYETNDLATLAFQSATGSGKTLIMHAHLLQYQHYAKRFGRATDNIYLVTPDADMSAQHLREMRQSRIAARLFQKDAGTGIFGMQPVQIIDIHKLGDETKDVVVDVRELGTRNLVLVDEGHLGMAGTDAVTRQRRGKLAADGFTLEYSATFNQIVENEELLSHYSKCLLFDYSYRHFYRDGYGKDHSVANLATGLQDENHRAYQVGAMLLFYQQTKIYEQLGSNWADYNITRPLWVMLGHTVTTAKGKLSAKGRTDIVEIIRFLHWVLEGRKEVEREIEAVLAGEAGLLSDTGSSDWFTERLSWLKLQDLTPMAMYDDLCQNLFHGVGSLHLVYLTQGQGELHLKSSENGEVFGVINVGAPSEVYKLLREGDVGINAYTHREAGFTERLFRDVDAPDSPVNILIGAKKFIAGWNSWRVSTMTLLNVGVGQGPQIIQMFGRGVRLKGLGFSLKRHKQLDAPIPEYSEELSLLETLNIFGLRADYMKKFKEMLGKEQIQPDMELFKIPVKTQLPKSVTLPMLRTRIGKTFEADGDKVKLTLANYQHVARLDLYSKMQTVGDGDEDLEDHTKKLYRFDAEIALFDKSRIYNSLLAFKQRRKMHNLELGTGFVDQLMGNNDWYQLYAPKSAVRLRSMSDVKTQENRFIDLACKLIEANWKIGVWNWEKENKEVGELKSDDVSIIKEYTVAVETEFLKVSEGRQKDWRTLVDDIDELCEKMEERKLPSLGLEIIMPSRHAYVPVIYQHDKSRVTIKPLPLNKGEKQTVQELVALVGKPPIADFELYLLRNASRSGTGFYGKDAYYPDFICWLIGQDETHMIFLDPKGLVHGDNHAKIDLHKSIRDVEQHLDRPEMRLHSYILSVSEDVPTNSEDGVYSLVSEENCLKKVLEHAINA